MATLPCDNGRRLPSDVVLEPLDANNRHSSYNGRAESTPFTFPGLEHWVGAENVARERATLASRDELDIMIDAMYVAKRLPAAVSGDGCDSSTYARIASRTARRTQFEKNDFVSSIFLRGVTEAGSTIVVQAPDAVRLPVFLELQCNQLLLNDERMITGILTHIARAGRCSPSSLTYELGTRNKIRYFESSATTMTIWFNNEVAWRRARYDLKRILNEGARQLVIRPPRAKRKRTFNRVSHVAEGPNDIRVNIDAHELDVQADVYLYQQWGLKQHSWARLLKNRYTHIDPNGPVHTHCVHEVKLRTAATGAQACMIPIDKPDAIAPHLAAAYDLETVGDASDDIFTDATKRGDVILMACVSFSWKGAVPPGCTHQVGDVFLRWCGSLLPMKPVPGLCIDVMETRSEAALINRLRDILVVHMDVWCTFGWNNIMFDNPFLVKRNVMLDEAADRFPYRHWMRHLDMEPREKTMKTGSDKDKAVILFDGRMCFDGLFWDRDHSRKRVFGSSLNVVASEELGAQKQPVKWYHINAVWHGRDALGADDGSDGEEETKGDVATGPDINTGQSNTVSTNESWGGGWSDDDEEGEGENDGDDRDSGSEEYLDEDEEDDGSESMEADVFEPVTTTLDDVTKIAVYCAVDCDLCLKIDHRLGYVGQIMQQAAVTCTDASVIALSGEQTKLLRYFVRRAHDAPQRYLVDGIGEAGDGGDDNMYASFGYAGGTVVNPAPAMYRAKHPKTDQVVGIEDFASLYPSLMRENNFGPSTCIRTKDLAKYRAAGYPVKGFKGKTLSDPNAFYYHIQYIPAVVDLGKDGDARAEQIVKLGVDAAEKARKEGASPGEVRERSRLATAIFDERGQPLFYRRCEKDEETGRWFQHNDLADGITKRPAQGLLPYIETTLLAYRKDAKGLKKKWGRAGDKAKADMYDGRQLALKVVMNAFYGFLGVGFNKDSGKLMGRFPCVRVADVITVAGGLALRRCVEYVETTYGASVWTDEVGDGGSGGPGTEYAFGAYVVYGDTDSIMVHVKGLPLMCAMRFLKRLETELTVLFGSAMEMEFENAMVTLLCLASKMYAGIKLIEPSLDVAAAYVRGDATIELYGKTKPVTAMYIKGLKPVRRDNAPICRTILKDVLSALFSREDGGPGTALIALQAGLDKLVTCDLTIDEFVTTKKVKDESEYKKVSYPPEQLIPVWMMEKRVRGSAPGAGSRIPLVTVRKQFANKEVLVPPAWRHGAKGWKRHVAMKKHKVSKKMEPPTATVTRHPDDVNLCDVDRAWYLWHQMYGPLTKMLWCCKKEVESVLRAAEHDIITRDKLFPIENIMAPVPPMLLMDTVTAATWTRSKRVIIDNERSMLAKRPKYIADVWGNRVDPRWLPPKSSASTKRTDAKKKAKLRELFIAAYKKRQADIVRMRNASSYGRRSVRAPRVHTARPKKKRATMADFFANA